MLCLILVIITSCFSSHIKVVTACLRGTRDASALQSQWTFNGLMDVAKGRSPFRTWQHQAAFRE